MFEENDNAGIGIIFQNSRGEVMVALSEKIPKTSSGGNLGDASYEVSCQICSGNRFAWLFLKVTLLLVSKLCKEEICYHPLLVT